MTIGVIDLGFSNTSSLVNALERFSSVFTIKTSEDWISHAHSLQKIIFPGVGNFNTAMKIINESNIGELLVNYCKNGGHYLGICLGMQILCEEGFEGGGAPGLGIIPGVVKKLSPLNFNEKIPHNGWNEVYWSEGNLLKEGIENGKDFYFNHSYTVHTTKEFIGAKTPYGGEEITSMIQINNVFGTQFHPEKSQTLGSRILKNFIELPC